MTTALGGLLSPPGVELAAGEVCTLTPVTTPDASNELPSVFVDYLASQCQALDRGIAMAQRICEHLTLRGARAKADGILAALLTDRSRLDELAGCLGMAAFAASTETKTGVSGGTLFGVVGDVEQLAGMIAAQELTYAAVRSLKSLPAGARAIAADLEARAGHQLVEVQRIHADAAGQLLGP